MIRNSEPPNGTPHNKLNVKIPFVFRLEHVFLNTQFFIGKLSPKKIIQIYYITTLTRYLHRIYIKKL
jgi:hypothetical protein